MRAIWKGAVSFGLVSISVKLYAATEEKSIRFNQVHREDGGRIRYQRICSVCGEEVSYDEIAKGYDIGGGEMVILDDADFEDLPLSTSRAIDVLEFVPSDQVDPILYAHAYYLEPESNATKPYVLLRDALTGSDRVAIVKVALRQREQLATLRVREGVLVLNTMLWPDEVREPDFGFLGEKIAPRQQELAMAGSLIDSMAGDFDPDAYTDEYRAALQQVIDAKVSGREIVAPPERAPQTAGVVDLMAALRASVDRAKAARGEDEVSGTGGRPAGTRQAAGRQAGGRQAGGRQTGGRQAGGRPGGRQAGGGERAAGRNAGPPAEPTPITQAKSAKKAAESAAAAPAKSGAKKAPARKAPAKKTATKSTAKKATPAKTRRSA